MPNELIQYAYVAGEIAPKLIGRTDLEKYDLGVALAKNMFVEYQGGLSTRPGTKFVDYIQHADKDIRVFRFQLSPDVANTYLVLFGEYYIRFVQDGAYVVDTALTITNVSIDPVAGVVTTSAAHGLTSGDWVSLSGIVGTVGAILNGRTFEVTVLTGTTFSLKNVFGLPFPTTGYAYTSGGEVAPIYTLVSPYPATALAGLSVKQVGSSLRITSTAFATRSLTRTAHTNWTIAQHTFGAALGAPTIGLITPSTSGSAGFVAAVTAVDENGEESRITSYGFEKASVNYASTAGWAKIRWSPVTGAVRYNVYRSNINPSGTDVGYDDDVGYIGTSYGFSFNDTNIIPDFTVSPPQQSNPFVRRRVQSFTINAAGTGYSPEDKVNITGDGSGFIGYVIIGAAGNILGVRILAYGSGYTTGTVSITTSTGSGASLSVTFTDEDGVFPAVSAVFEQREIYAGSSSEPITVWGSKIGYFQNFDVSYVPNDADAITFSLDAEEVSPIRHAHPTDSGLLLFTRSNVWLIYAPSAGTISASNIDAKPQTHTGASTLPPIAINEEILFEQDKGATIHALIPNQYTRASYGVRDMSILSNHLFGNGYSLRSWTYAEHPFKLIYAARSDGAMLTGTYDSSQQVYAWTQNWTKGFFQEVLRVQEGSEDVVYAVVRRYINGEWSKFIERFDTRQFKYVEDAWCVDCGLEYPLTYPNATLSVGAADGDSVLIVAGSAVFSSSNVGDVLRVGGGKATVVTYVNTTSVRVNFSRPITAVIPEDPSNRPQDFDSGDWSLTTPITTVSGLWHLEGEFVDILADGNVHPQRQVLAGQITLDAPASRIIIGLNYVSRVKTLPPTTNDAVIEARRKTPVAIGVRVYNSRGMKVGRTFESLYEVKERTTEAYGEPITLQSGYQYSLVTPEWDEEGQTCLQMDQPLPATVIGHVVDLEVGDDADG